MTKRITLLCYLLGLMALANNAPLAAEQSSRPNILFLFADDQTYESIHALGNDEIETPNLDRLDRSGTTLTHAYNQGGFHGAVCVASRTMLVSGHQTRMKAMFEKLHSLQTETGDKLDLAKAFSKL